MPLNDCANGCYVDVLFTCDECGFTSLGAGPVLRSRYGIE